MFKLEALRPPAKVAYLPTANRDSRRLFIVDIENAASTGALTPADARAAAVRLRKTVGYHPDEQTIVGVSSSEASFPASAAFPGKLLRVGFGPSGAENALLADLDIHCIAARFDEVILVSGDGIFANTVAALAARGLRVTVLGHPDGVSRELRMAAHSTIYFH